MACQCRDKNGDLLNQCLGVCPDALEAQQNYRCLQQFGDHMKEMIRELGEQIDLLKYDIKQNMIEVYEGAFLRGFNVAKDMYE